MDVLFELVDFFSGVGGFSVAAHQVGGKTIAFCEKSPFCRKLLVDNFGNEIPIYEDINTFPAESFRAKRNGLQRIFSAGFPCQPYSHAGRRAGDSDDRFLWPQTLDVVVRGRPAWAVFENVAGLLTMVESDSLSEVERKEIRLFCEDNDDYDRTVVERIHRRIIGRVIDDLRQAGYLLPRAKDGRPIVLCVPACAVGAPHRRDRIWIIAYDAQNTRRIRQRGRSNGDTRGSSRAYQVARSDSALWQQAIIDSQDDRAEGRSREVSGTDEKVQNEHENSQPVHANFDASPVSADTAGAGLEGTRQATSEKLPAKGRKRLDARSKHRDRSDTYSDQQKQQADGEPGRYSQQQGRSVEAGRQTLFEGDRPADTEQSGGPASPDTNTDRERRSERLHEPGSERTVYVGAEPLRSNPEGTTGAPGNDTDSDSQRLQGIILDREQQENFEDPTASGYCGEWGTPWYEAATQLCGMDDGLPSELDITEKAAIYRAVELFGAAAVSQKIGWDCSQVENLVFRNSRLEVLGNAIVPEIAVQIFGAILAAEFHFSKIRRTRK